MQSSFLGCQFSVYGRVSLHESIERCGPCGRSFRFNLLICLSRVKVICRRKTKNKNLDTRWRSRHCYQRFKLAAFLLYVVTTI